MEECKVLWPDRQFPRSRRLSNEFGHLTSVTQWTEAFQAGLHGALWVPGGPHDSDCGKSCGYSNVDIVSQLSPVRTRPALCTDLILRFCLNTVF